MMNPWRSLGGLPRGVWILALSSLINRMGTMAIPFITLYLTRTRGMSPAHAGLVLIVLGLGAILAGPLAGRLADRIGSTRMIHVSLWSFAVIITAFPFVESTAGLFVVSFFAGAAGEAFRPANLSLTSRLAGPERAKAAFALLRLAVNLGMSIGPAVGGFLAERNFSWVFYVDGATSALAALFLLFARLPADTPAPAAAGARAREGWLPVHALADRRFMIFWLAMLFVGLVFFQEMGAMAVDLVELRGYSPQTFGLLFTINTVLIVFLEVPLNGAMGRWPHGRSMALGALLFGVGFGALALVGSAAAIAGTVVIWTFGEMILFPTASAYVAELAPEERRGEYMGMYSMTFAVAHSVGPWAGLQVMAAFGTTVLWACTFLVGAIGAWVLHHTAPRSGR